MAVIRTEPFFGVAPWPSSSSPTPSGSAFVPSFRLGPNPTARPPRSPTHREPEGPDRHPVRPQDRDQLGGPSGRDGLRLGHDLVAPSASGWTVAGVWAELREVLLAELEGAGQIDWSRAIIDSGFVRARGRARRQRAPARWTGERKGASIQLITDAHGVPLAVTTTGGERPGCVPMVDLVDAIPPVRGKPGRPRCRPRRCSATEATIRTRSAAAFAHGIRPRIARRYTPHGSGLGKYRWYVERTLAWLHGFGRLRVPARIDPQQSIRNSSDSLARLFVLDCYVSTILLGLLNKCSWPEWSTFLGPQ